MSTDSALTTFIEKALAVGIPYESLVGLLTSQGWPQREVYDALANHFRRVIGVDIPRRSGAAASAKEAFFYLLIFSTLAVWTFNLVTLASALIDQWFNDPLFSTYSLAYNTNAVSSALAGILIAFPIFLFISNIVLRDAAKHPEQLDSPIRRWLTYMALVVAAGVFMGDLITALTYLLTGEFTSRFLAKALVVLILSGGVFFYYFGGVRKVEGAVPSPG